MRWGDFDAFVKGEHKSAVGQETQKRGLARNSEPIRDTRPAESAVGTSIGVVALQQPRFVEDDDLPVGLEDQFGKWQRVAVDDESVAIEAAIKSAVRIEPSKHPKTWSGPAGDDDLTVGLNRHDAGRGGGRGTSHEGSKHRDRDEE
ncbi:MAG TPA: hypothetical protein VIM28_10085 [Solirubrobacterales bacterium]